MIAKAERTEESQVVGRYVLYGPIAHGGMATVHFARLVGSEGFSRIVAAKRLNKQFTEDPEFVQMFRNEARIASLIHHPNVVPVLDLVLEDGEIIVVQEYVHGIPLDKLFRRAVLARQAIPPNIVSAIACGVLAGLHAAHETKDERGEPLGIIHRDVSPHNIIVGEDGVPRIVDFGIAKARTGAHATRDGLMKGKLTYMAPEQFRGEPVTRKVDIYSCAIVMWELATMQRLHAGRDDLEILRAVMHDTVPRVSQALSEKRSSMDPVRWKEILALEPVIARAITGRTEDRYATASEALEVLTSALPPALPSAVAEWACTIGRDYLEQCQNMLASNEDSWRSTSKIDIAQPESGFKIVTRNRPTPPPLPRRAADPPQREVFGKRVMLAALVVFLVALGVLIGSLVHREPPVQEPVTIVAPPPNDPVTIAPIELRPPVAAAPAPPPATTKAKIVFRAPVVVHPAPAPTPTATVDCDPPFYFEGTKKVFKAGCM